MQSCSSRKARSSKIAICAGAEVVSLDVAKEITSGTSAAAHPKYIAWAKRVRAADFEDTDAQVASAAGVDGASVHRAFSGEPSRCWPQIARAMKMPEPFFPVRSPEEAELLALQAELHDLDESAFLRLLDAARHAVRAAREDAAARKAMESLTNPKRR